MKLPSILLALSIFAVSSTSAQKDPFTYDSDHNATTLIGTWSSGSQAVVTGAGFADPANFTFTYPKTAGVSYSFSDDGFYEIAGYRFLANGTMPNCITGVLQWVHGNYTLFNGTINMVPFPDGFQQIQDPCAAESNFIDYGYNYTQTLSQWRIFKDPTQGYKLHLFLEDGTPVAPQYLVSTSPNMLPTRSLRKEQPAAATTSAGYVSGGSAGSKRSHAGKRWIWS